MDGLEKEVNFILCENLNIKALIENCDINAVAVFVNVRVENKKVSFAEWIVGSQFWHFLFISHVLQP